MKLCLVSALAALSLSLTACEDKNGAAKPPTSATAANTAQGAAPAATDKPSEGGW